jgi:hypothetical protein
MKRLQISLAVLAVALSATLLLTLWANRYRQDIGLNVGWVIVGIAALAFLSFTTWMGLMLVAGGVEWTVDQVREIATARGVRAKLIAVGGLLLGAVVAYWFLRYLLFGGCSAVEATTGC